MEMKPLISKLQRAFLCCADRNRPRPHHADPEPTIHIGFPTDVRRLDVSDLIPGLTDAERSDIREKASRDAIETLNLPLQPPNRPVSSPSSPATGISACPETYRAARPTTSPPQLVVSAPSSGEISFVASREQCKDPLSTASKDRPTSMSPPPELPLGCDPTLPMRTGSACQVVERRPSASGSDSSFERGETALQREKRGSIYSGLAATDFWFEVGSKRKDVRSDASSEEGVEGSSVEDMFAGGVTRWGMVDMGAEGEVMPGKGSRKVVLRSEGNVSLLDGASVDHFVEGEQTPGCWNSSADVKGKAHGENNL